MKVITTTTATLVCLGILTAGAGGMRVEGSSEQEDGQVDNRLYGLQVRANIHSLIIAMYRSYTTSIEDK